MNEAQTPATPPTEVQPKTVISFTTGLPRPETDIDRLLDQQDQQRKAAVAANPDAYLPNLQELRVTDENISDQAIYWSGIRAAVDNAVAEWEAREKDAKKILEELKAITDRPITSDEKRMIAASQEALSKVAWRLRRDRNRLLVAEQNVKTWAERREAFDKNDRQRMIRLKREEDRKQRVLKMGRMSDY